MTKTNRPVIAIGLDATDPQLLETWTAQGKLPTLAAFMEEGAYTRLTNTVLYAGQVAETSFTERLWAMFGTGCLPNKTGYWGPIHYNPETYEAFHNRTEAYDYREYPPFYGLGDRYRVAAFDVPSSALNEHVKGLQILGWGGHAPQTPSHSDPAPLYAEIIKQYGRNPLLHRDDGYWWDQAYLQRVTAGLSASSATRAKICRDLLTREPWDLFLTVFGETHTAGHYLWHYSHSDNPLHCICASTDSDYLLTAFQQVDQAIAQIIDAAPSDAQVVIFSVHGMQHNASDLNTMVFLPELLYRYSFPGRQGLSGRLGQLPLPINQPRRKTWPGQIWQARNTSNPIRTILQQWTPSKFDAWLGTGPEPYLSSPYTLQQQGNPLSWMPAAWYQRLWPRMKAFALPTFAAGHIRINLQGREPNGVVGVADYEAVCDELTAHLTQLRDPRTGKVIVKNVFRTRTKDNILDSGPKLPDADLVVRWTTTVTDTVDSPEFGRIGPLTYYRTGEHRTDGFLLVKSPATTAGSPLKAGQAIDIGPTILRLMGAPQPSHLEGSSLL